MYENPEQAFGGTAQLLSLIETIYAAVQDPVLWQIVTEKIADAVRGESTTIFARFPEEQLFSMTRTDAAAWDLYATYYASVNVLMDCCDRVFADGAVRYADRAMPDAVLEKTEFYNDFFKPNDMHYSLGLKIPLGQLPAAYMTCQRPKVNGPFTEQEGPVYTTLLPHLQRALSLHVQLTQLQLTARGLESALDAFDQAVFGIDRLGKVILSNQSALKLALTGDPMRISGSMLCTPDPAQNRRLQASILKAIAAAAAAGAGTSFGTSLLIYRVSGLQPLRMTVTPFMSPLRGTSAQLAALVFVADPSRRPQPRSAALRNLYNLTPTEARVSDSLLQGLELRDLAGRLGMTLETARFHTKRILAKTGVRRQTELMRLMLSLPGE